LFWRKVTKSFYKFQLFAQDFDGVYAIVMIKLWVDSKLVKKNWHQELFLEGMINKK